MSDILPYIYSIKIDNNCGHFTLKVIISILLYSELNSYIMPRGVNSQGNSYNTPGGTNSSTGSSYHYSNSNGSYYYQNDNGSTYYNPGSSGAGSISYSAPRSSGGSGSSGGGGSSGGAASSGGSGGSRR